MTTVIHFVTLKWWKWRQLHTLTLWSAESDYSHTFCDFEVVKVTTVTHFDTMKCWKWLQSCTLRLWSAGSEYRYTLWHSEVVKVCNYCHFSLRIRLPLQGWPLSKSALVQIWHQKCSKVQILIGFDYSSDQGLWPASPATRRWQLHTLTLWSGESDDSHTLGDFQVLKVTTVTHFMTLTCWKWW